MIKTPTDRNRPELELEAVGTRWAAGATTVAQVVA